MLRFFRHILLRFNHAVEIGAERAYEGHYIATDDFHVWLISREEYGHRQQAKRILAENGKKPFWLFDATFFVIGTAIMALCPFCPRWSLNWVARTMEIFAIFNYGLLAKLYPEHREEFLEMAKAEEEHRLYFK